MTGTKGANALLKAVKALQDYCCDSDLEHARQHIEAALGYYAEGEREQAVRRITCAHVALQHMLEIHTREDDGARQYLRSMILGEGDADIIMARLVMQAAEEAAEVTE